MAPMSQPPGRFRPALDVAPVPDEGGLERGDRLGEVGVPLPQRVDRLRVGDAEALRNLVSAH